MNMVRFVRKSILRKFIDLRLLSQKKLPYDEIIRVELLVAMCLISFVSGMSYVVMGLFVHASLLNILNHFFYFITAIPLVLYLCRKGYYNQAKLVMMFIGTLFMFIKASSMGREAGMNLAMLIILFGIFAFYRIEDYKYILLALFLLLSCFLILELTDYSWLGHDLSTNAFEYEYNLVFTIFFCILFFYVILRVNQYINKKLFRLNNKLLIKNRKLAKINDELDSYIYKVSHDMRAPVTSMMGIISLLEAEKDFEKTHQLIELQKSCVTRLDDHIHQIMNLSVNIKTALRPEKINFQQVIAETFEELSLLDSWSLIEKKVTISQDIDFYSDRYRLKVILTNLISNACKYSRKPEPVIHINIIVTSASASVSVRDNGIGIATEHQGKIFDMFYRGTDISKGSGLGLYMVREMIHKLNGTIELDSIPNTYTVIKCIIPNLEETDIIQHRK